jgi:hypothetical protein
MRRAPADPLHPNPAERDSKDTRRSRIRRRNTGHVLRAQCDPAWREPMGHSYGSHSETKDIEKALRARFWGYKGQIPLFWVCTFLQLKKEAMIRQRLITLYTH